MDDLLRSLVLVFLAAGAVLHVFHWLRVPAIVGLLIAGVVIGPFGMGVVRDAEQITLLADLGIILLMFSIGLDFTADRFRQLVAMSPIGMLQMAICIGVTTPIALLVVDRWSEAVFVGMLVAFGSSMLVMKILMDRGELGTPQGRLILGINVTQDLSVVPMLLAVPMMSRGEWAPAQFGLDLLRAAGALGVALALGRWVIPFWLHHVIRARSRELFLIFLTVVSLGMAWATTAAGLPASLGAFLAGMAIAGSAYSDQTLAEVVPFRDLLVSLFFISIGMLLNVAPMLDYLLPALAVIAAVLVLKFFSGLVPVLLWRYPLRIAILVGLAIAQIGEFAFVLVHAGRAEGLIEDLLFQFMVVVTVATMLASPILSAAGPAVARAALRVPALRRLERGDVDQQPEQEQARRNHVVIAGYGLNGRNLASALRLLEVPHVVLDLEPEKVRLARRSGEEVSFGDCTRPEVLRRADLGQARAFIVAISDREATRRAIQVGRHVNPAVRIIARTKYLSEIEPLLTLGANEVIAEEFETSLEILERTLRCYQVPRPRIDEVVRSLRGDAYEALREGSAASLRSSLVGSMLPSLEFESLSVAPTSLAVNRTVRELELRVRTGATLLAVQRDREMTTHGLGDMRLAEGDVLVLAGTPAALANAVKLLGPPEVTD